MHENCSMQEYSIRMKSLFGSINPNEAVTTLREIRRKEGRITAKLVLKYGKDEESPIHNFFEWDDSIAAEKHRLQQAGNLITNIRVTRDDDPENTEPIRLFVRSSDEKGSHYLEVDEVDIDDAKKIMDNAIRDLKKWVKRYNELSRRLPGIFEEVDKVVRMIDLED